MKIEFQDRVSKYPNRYKVTKENGTSEHVTLERADEPIVVGTPLNAETFNTAFSEIPNNVISGNGICRNLLDNSDFTNPVNQRRQVTYEAPSGAPNNIDRWYANRATVTVDDDGITLLRNTTASTSATYIGQKIEDPSRLIGLTLTLAFMTGNGLIVGSGVFTGNNLTFCTKDGWTAFFTKSTNAFVLQTETKASIKLYWAALYEGKYTEETLPGYQPKGYGVELAECQRYLFAIGTFAHFRMDAKSADRIQFTIPIPEMRAIPTFTGDCVIYDISGNSQSGFEFSSATYCFSFYRLDFEKASHGLNDAYLKTTGYCFVSAEL